jgi:hypothetical protein
MKKEKTYVENFKKEICCRDLEGHLIDTIKKLQEIYDEAIKQECQNIYINFENGDEYTSDLFNIRGSKEETDEEHKKRLKKEKEWVKKQKEAQEKAKKTLYLKLKKEFEGDS